MQVQPMFEHGGDEVKHPACHFKHDLFGGFHHFVPPTSNKSDMFALLRSDPSK